MDDKEKIKKIRKITGLSAEQFAQEIGLGGSSTVYSYEKGRAPVKKIVWRAIDTRFGHLYQWIDKPDGTRYPVAAPEAPPRAADGPEEPTEYGGQADYGENQIYHDMLEAVMTGRNQRDKYALMTNCFAFYGSRDDDIKGFEEMIVMYDEKIREDLKGELKAASKGNESPEGGKGQSGREKRRSSG